MNWKKISIPKLILLLLIMVSTIQAQTKITVDVNKPGHAISPTLFGIFFEDINLSADGGLYPEMVRNRSFEDADTLQNWKFSSIQGKSVAKISNAEIYAKPQIPPLNPFNRKSLLITAAGSFKLENSGYWGMNMEQGGSYTLKLAARAIDGFSSPLKVRILDAKDNEISAGEIKGITDNWGYYTANLKISSGDPKASLEISGEGNGKLFLDMVSLMPDKTWKNHGMRTDLAEALDAIHPKLFRFPGGCWVEGNEMKQMNHWKNTIGNIDTRSPLWNFWGYNATNGLGFHEYLQLAEDLGAEPLYCINVGMSHSEVIPMDQMGQWVQDALDAIEYANGPVTSVWGGIRAKNGHPEPFNLKYMEIGNENGGTSYNERWPLFVKAIQAKYPYMKLVANEWAGGHPNEPKPELIDEHYYNNPDWFIWNSNKYDRYNRNDSKIFVGEYAVTSGTGNGNLRGAIGEAAWMTGMERNSDIVEMAAYAPLLCNTNHKAWPINLINFDSYRWFGLPSYYVQQMFSNNQGTNVLPFTVENNPVIETAPSMGGIGFGTWMTSAEFKDVVVTAPDGKILFKPDFTKVDNNWRQTGKGQWSVKDGILKQSAIEQGVSVFMGDSTWKDCTINLKARKISGENGFQIYFHNKKNDDHNRFEVGGWSNSVMHLEMGMATAEMKAEAKTEQWYDVKIEIKGKEVRAYLDGKLVQEISDKNLAVKSLIMSAVKDDKSGDVILKVVNASAKSIKTEIDLKAEKAFTGKAKAIVLTSATPLDENTLENPKKVYPKTEDVKLTGTGCKRTFPGNSLTVIRFGTKK
ncbi:MAG: alpha-L-arabinofuranosidase C-terminal domain-containing protein [Bacteroidota bacterium]|nr:alpha-L-arabinofuranosidase C-terminal domain-containing protein [Bacteroidota bacterium]